VGSAGDGDNGGGGTFGGADGGDGDVSSQQPHVKQQWFDVYW